MLCFGLECVRNLLISPNGLLPLWPEPHTTHQHTTLQHTQHHRQITEIIRDLAPRGVSGRVALARGADEERLEILRLTRGKGGGLS